MEDARKGAEIPAHVRVEGIENAAQSFIDGLACMLEVPGNKILRFTPSVKLGRRYLHVECSDGFDYAITVQVNRTEYRQ
jgi:hypothetical protein